MNDDITLLYKYIVSNRIEKCEKILKKKPELYNEFSESCNKTPLMMAVEDKYRHDLIHVFRDLGYSVNEIYKGVHLLAYATICPKCWELETLLICGADPNTITNMFDRNLTILSRVIKFVGPKTEEYVNDLLHYGADPNIQDELGNNSLHYAATSRPTIMPMLLRYGGNCYAKNNNNETPLDRAVLWNKNDIIKILQEHDMNIRKCVNLLEMARYFDENSLIHEDYFPLDLLKIFIQMMQHKM